MMLVFKTYMITVACPYPQTVRVTHQPHTTQTGKSGTRQSPAGGGAWRSDGLLSAAWRRVHGEPFVHPYAAATGAPDPADQHVAVLGHMRLHVKLC